MAVIRIHQAACTALLKAAKKYGEENKIDGPEMGVALVLAGITLLSMRINNVQLDEVLKVVVDMTADLRKRNSS